MCGTSHDLRADGCSFFFLLLSCNEFYGCTYTRRRGVIVRKGAQRLHEKGGDLYEVYSFILPLYVIASSYNTPLTFGSCFDEHLSVAGEGD